MLKVDHSDSLFLCALDFPLEPELIEEILRIFVSKRDNSESLFPQKSELP
jgi:hypothetical protein